MKAKSNPLAGRVTVAAPGQRKTRITIRLDDDILAWFRTQAGEGNYQSLINAALREHIAGKEDVLAETLRRVLREEMAAYESAGAAPAEPGSVGRARTRGRWRG